MEGNSARNKSGMESNYHTYLSCMHLHMICYYHRPRLIRGGFYRQPLHPHHQKFSYPQENKNVARMPSRPLAGRPLLQSPMRVVPSTPLASVPLHSCCNLYPIIGIGVPHDLPPSSSQSPCSISGGLENMTITQRGIHPGG